MSFQSVVPHLHSLEENEQNFLLCIYFYLFQHSSEPYAKAAKHFNNYNENRRQISKRLCDFHRNLTKRLHLNEKNISMEENFGIAWMYCDEKRAKVQFFK